MHREDVGSAAHRICVRLFLHDRINLKLIQTSRAIQIGVQIRCGDAVNAHTEPSKLKSSRLGDHLKAGLGHAVSNETRLRLASLNTRHVDYAALSSDEHILEEVDEHVRRSHIKVLKEIEVLRERRLHVASKDDSCAVDEDVKLGLILFLLTILVECGHASRVQHTIDLFELMLACFN